MVSSKLPEFLPLQPALRCSFCLLVFLLWPLPCHMKVPRPGIKSKTELRQCQTLNPWHTARTPFLVLLLVFFFFFFNDFPIFIFLLFICFLGPHSWHMEVPRPGVQSEQGPPAYTTATATPDLHHSSQQSRILYPLREAGDQTRNFMVPSRIHFHCAMTGTPFYCSYIEH